MVSQLNKDFEDLKKYTDYIAEQLNLSVQRIDYLENVQRKRIDYLESTISDIKNVILDKRFIFKYLDDVDINILEQYIRKRKISNIYETKS